MKKLLVMIAVMLFTIPVAGQESERDRGIALYREGNYAEAAVALQKAVEIDKRDGPAWRYLGAVLVNLGEKADALKAFKQRDLDPASFAAERKKYDPPLKVINKRPAGYTEEARSLGIRGTILVVVEFRADGRIGFVFPTRTLPGGLTDNVIEAARGVRFQPAVQNGVPVTTIQMLSYSFDVH